MSPGTSWNTRSGESFPEAGPGPASRWTDTSAAVTPARFTASNSPPWRRSRGGPSGLEPGRPYALKILIPASGLRRRIRNLFYGIGFQAPFSLQSVAAAGRSQALWQKFIRRAAKIELGDEAAVVDIHGTFLDPRLGSFGEISEWVDGRMWRLEVDDDLDARRRARPDDPATRAGSPEYLTKRDFMDRLVRLLNEIGAEELARQYEWWSLKSQPNAMKRTSSDPDPRAGLVAVDFRAGMTLLPFLPECPADFKLIVRGIGAGPACPIRQGRPRKARIAMSKSAARNSPTCGRRSMSSGARTDPTGTRSSTSRIITCGSPERSFAGRSWAASGRAGMSAT